MTLFDPRIGIRRVVVVGLGGTGSVRCATA